MATYKVIQDIEAEDKLVGPLTLRQFIYAIAAAAFFYFSFLAIGKGAAFFAIFFIPMGLIGAFFAWPWSRDQPTEVWALAKIRFLLKPRKRVWDQSGIKELVTITAPKRIERALTNGLSQVEVKSRLRALADTIDSRGWAIKNVGVNLYSQPALSLADPDSDRLISVSSLPQPVSNLDIRASDDMLDVQNNPVAQQFDTMIAASAKAHRQEIIDRMKRAEQPAAAAPLPTPAPTPQSTNNYWFLSQPGQTSSVPQDTVTFNTQVVAPGTSPTSLPVAAATPTEDEEAFIKSHQNQPAFSPNMHGHLTVIQPLSAQKTAAPVASTPVQPPATAPVAQPQAAPAPKVTRAPETAILDLARNDDLNVATLAREAKKRTEQSQDEVVISLH